jgi:hypothetical protein
MARPVGGSEYFPPLSPSLQSKSPKILDLREKFDCFRKITPVYALNFRNFDDLGEIAWLEFTFGVKVTPRKQRTSGLPEAF